MLYEILHKDGVIKGAWVIDSGISIHDDTLESVTYEHDSEDPLQTDKLVLDGNTFRLMTEQELSDAAAAKQAAEDAVAYIWQRKEEYPPITDYIDGIVKGDEAQVQAYIDACQAVKNKYPKPEGI